MTGFDDMCKFRRDPDLDTDAMLEVREVIAHAHDPDKDVVLGLIFKQPNSDRPSRFFPDERLLRILGSEFAEGLAQSSDIGTENQYRAALSSRKGRWFLSSAIINNRLKRG